MNPAGWYPDPSGQPFQRFWDGTEWTAQTQSYPPPLTKESTGQTDQPGLPQAPHSAGDQAHHEHSSDLKKIIVGVVAAFVGVAVIAGLLIFNRIQVDERAREAARTGANLGGTPNSLRDMTNLLCPQGVDTPPQPGVDCSRADLFR